MENDPNCQRTTSSVETKKSKIKATISSFDDDSSSSEGGEDVNGKERSRTFRRRRLSLTDKKEPTNDNFDQYESNAKSMIRDSEKSSSSSMLSFEQKIIKPDSIAHITEGVFEDDDDNDLSHRKKRTKTTNDSKPSTSMVSEEHTAAASSSITVENCSPVIPKPILPVHIGLQSVEDGSLHMKQAASAVLSSSPQTGQNQTEWHIREQSNYYPTSSSKSDHEESSNKQQNDDSRLPFPRSIVGTYSCHGIEPIYDSDSSSSPLVDKSKRPTFVAKINQDRGGVAFPYANCNRTAFFTTYDGHGEGGELVSQYALHEIPKKLEQHVDFQRMMTASSRVDSGGSGNLETALTDVFLSVDRGLGDDEDIDPTFSGSTACLVLVRGDLLVSCNLGDSRAVLAFRSSGKDGASAATASDGGKGEEGESGQSSVYTALDLTVDQNPDSPGEQERIEEMGGFVSPQEDGLSSRVWLDPDCSQIGLAMSRSLGDHAVRSVGVIAEPVVSEHRLREEDEFMIIATDGVWEFLSSQDAVDIVAKDLDNGQGSSVACQHLIEAAAAKWHEYEGDYRDDITALVIRVKELWNKQ